MTTPNFSYGQTTQRQQPDKFKYLAQIDQEVKQPNLSFVPYFQERSQFGHILDKDDKDDKPLD